MREVGRETTYDCPRKAHANKQTTCSVCNKFAINVFFLEILFLLASLCLSRLLSSSWAARCVFGLSCDFEVTTCTPLSTFVAFLSFRLM